MDSSTLAKYTESVGDSHTPGMSLITGSRGQDGSYLSDLLGHEKIIGCINPGTFSAKLTARNEVSLDLGDKDSVMDLLRAVRPSSIFHLAARHGPSSRMTFEKADIEAMQKLHVLATRNLLESIESLRLGTHLVVAGSSRIFTATEDVTRVSEDSSPNPQDFYGESKLIAWETVKKFRQDFGINASFLVLFNHESPRRPEGYFSTDVSKSIYNYLRGESGDLRVRDASASADWSDARDVVETMAAVSKLPFGEDFIVASGSARSVREIISNVFTLLGEKDPPELTSEHDRKNRTPFALSGDNSKSVNAEVWNPTITIEHTIVEMVQNLLGEKGA